MGKGRGEGIGDHGRTKPVVTGSLRWFGIDPGPRCASLVVQGVDNAAVWIVLEPGMVSFHDPFVLHGAEPNNSGARRGGLTFR